jgi:hypothetical protein
MNIVDFRYVYLPYCLQKQPNGGYVVLNRDHKPLGFATDNFITYDEFPVTAKIEGITSKLAKQLSYDNSDDVDMIYLYTNDTNPVLSAENMRAYSDKLALLATLQVMF